MKRIVCLFLFLLIGAFAFSQSADVITDILKSEEASVGQLCYLSAVSQGFAAADTSYEDACYALFNNNQLNSLDIIDDLVTADFAAAIMAKAWPVNGGLMFRLTNGGKRYAFKQLQADGAFTSDVEPSKILSGPDVLNLYSACLRIYGGFDISSVSME